MYDTSFPSGFIQRTLTRFLQKSLDKMGELL